MNHPHGRLYLVFKYGFVTILLWLLSETILAHWAVCFPEEVFKDEFCKSWRLHFSSTYCCLRSGYVLWLTVERILGEFEWQKLVGKYIYNTVHACPYFLVPATYYPTITECSLCFISSATEFLSEATQELSQLSVGTNKRTVLSQCKRTGVSSCSSLSHRLRGLYFHTCKIPR